VLTNSRLKFELVVADFFDKNVKVGLNFLVNREAVKGAFTGSMIKRTCG